MSETFETKKPQVQPGAFKLKEAALYLGGINPETLRRLMRRGLVKPCRAFRHLLFTRQELDRFLAASTK